MQHEMSLRTENHQNLDQRQRNSKFNKRTAPLEMKIYQKLNDPHLRVISNRNYYQNVDLNRKSKVTERM